MCRSPPRAARRGTEARLRPEPLAPRRRTAHRRRDRPGRRGRGGEIAARAVPRQLDAQAPEYLPPHAALNRDPPAVDADDRPPICATCGVTMVPPALSSRE